LAEHENYCGSRTERCEDCGEFVMLKYQQLHQDSNHGFLKLEDGKVQESLHFGVNYRIGSLFPYFALPVSSVLQLSFPCVPTTSLII
jgi:hypothetical protein